MKFVALPVPEIIGGTKKLGQSLDTPTLDFLANFKLAFVRTDPPNISAKLTYVALPIPEIIGGTSKIWAVPGYAHASFSPKILKGFCSDGPCEYTYYLPNLKFVALSVPEIIGGTQKIWAVPGYAHAPFSPKFFMGLCSDGPGECIGQICSP